MRTYHNGGAGFPGQCADNISLPGPFHRLLHDIETTGFGKKPYERFFPFRIPGARQSEALLEDVGRDRPDKNVLGRGTRQKASQQNRRARQSPKWDAEPHGSFILIFMLRFKTEEYLFIFSLTPGCEIDLADKATHSISWHPVETLLTLFY